MRTRSIVGYACVLVLASSLGLPAAAQLESVYNITVKVEGGGGFLDCWEFHADGSLVMATMSDPLRWAKLKLNAKKGTFQAATLTGSADGFTLMFSGKARAKLNADGFNPDAGITFKIKGKRDNSVMGCAPLPTRRPAPYQTKGPRSDR